MIAAPPDAPATRWTLLLIGLAVLSAAVYATAFTLTWPLWTLYTQPQADYTWFGRYTPGSQATYIGAFVALFALQYVAYRLVRARPESASLDLILSGQVIFGIFNVWIYPVAALDLYDYLMYGRIVLVYGGNPFFDPPSAFPDPLVAYSPWPNERSVYGPVWQILSLLPTAFAGESMLRGLISFKVLGLVTFIACTLVIWRILRQLTPRLAPAGALLFGWNPLLQFELVGNGHNDVLMVLFVLLAVWALLAHKRILVLPLLALAILTKLLAIALGPVILYGLLRGRGSLREKLTAILGGGALGLAIAVALYAPFWRGLDTLYFLSRGNWFTASLPTMLRELLRLSYSYEEAGSLSATIVGLGFAAFTLLRLYLLWREERSALTPGPPLTPRPPLPACTNAGPLGCAVSPASGEGEPASEHRPDEWLPWLGAAHDVTFVYLAFFTLWWQPWYLTWLVALAALLPSRLVHERALLFCFGGTLNYVVFKYVWAVFQPMTYPTIMGISVILIFGLPLLHLVSTIGVRERRQDAMPV